MANRKLGRMPAHHVPAPVAGRETDRPTEATERVSRPSVASVVTRLAVTSSDPPEHVFRHLLSAYLGGARAFEIVERPTISPRTRQVVQEFCRRTRQPQIVRENGRTLELVDLEVGDTGALDGRLHRLGELVLEFHREAVESWDHLPLGDDGLWGRKDDDVDREAWYLERCIALEQDGTAGRSSTATAAWTIARSLERIADHAVTLGEVGPRLADLSADGGLLRELRQFHRQAMGHLDEVLRSPDGSRANDLLDVGQALLAGGRALSERLLPAVGDGSMAPASAAAVARALEAIGRTIAYSQDIAQAFFDRALREPASLRPSGAAMAIPAPAS